MITPVRTMFDGINPATVPAGAAIYAGYDQGAWQSYAALKAQHPGKRYVSICVNASGRAKCLDVENGDATPQQAPGWAQQMRALGDPFPWVYMSESTWPTVIREFQIQRVEPALWWVASYLPGPPSLSNPPAIPNGAIGLQAFDYGGYDISFMKPYIPGFDPAPVGVPTLEEDDDMITTSVNGRVGIPWSSGSRHVIEAQYANAGQVDLVLDVELKGKGGSVYPGSFTIPHTAGSAVYEIPQQYVPACTGVILTVKSGPANVVFDVFAA